MKATVEISGKRKDGKSFVVYRTVALYDGIAADLYDRYESTGCSDLRIRII